MRVLGVDLQELVLHSGFLTDRGELQAYLKPQAVATDVELSLKYYIYISLTKINMLYMQCESRVFNSSPSEYSKLSVVTKHILSHEQVGTAIQPKRYIADTLPLRWGVLWNYKADLAFFGIITDDLALALIGSSGSLVGHGDRVEANHSLDCYEIRWLNSVTDDSLDQDDVLNVSLEAKINRNNKSAGWVSRRERAEMSSDTYDYKKDDYYEYVIRSIELAIQEFPGRMQNLEFLAKTIYAEKRGHRLLVVATPLYVALV